jgi:hypothetical protein
MAAWFLIMMLVATLLPVAALAQNPPQTPPNPGQQGQQGRGLLGRQSPPQPQQKPGSDYFLGTWDFTWSGRETPLTPGPRSGKATFSKGTAPNTLTVAVDGKVEDGPAYKESGSIAWNDTSKELTVVERLAGGVELRGVASWTSPIGMTFETAPIQAGGRSVRVKRTYSILSATSFSILEEISTDGGPYQRVGTGAFNKQP